MSFSLSFIFSFSGIFESARASPILSTSSAIPLFSIFNLGKSIISLSFLVTAIKPSVSFFCHLYLSDHSPNVRRAIFITFSRLFSTPTISSPTSTGSLSVMLNLSFKVLICASSLARTIFSCFRGSTAIPYSSTPASLSLRIL